MAVIPLLLETIRLQEGRLLHLPGHQYRMDRTLKALSGIKCRIDLAGSLRIPEDKMEGRFKVRVLYRENLEKIEILPYSIRPVKRLQLVDAGQLTYPFKYADRSGLQHLFDQRTYGDDILLVRNGYITDTSYANVALFDGHKWYTPARPLLAGTARARLLKDKVIDLADIKRQDLPDFQQSRLINAMMNWEEGPVIEVANVSS
jgi:4-amino-4-deoxychorismate lyase